jgi:hypothetical protein
MIWSLAMIVTDGEMAGWQAMRKNAKIMASGRLIFMELL